MKRISVLSYFPFLLVCLCAALSFLGAPLSLSLKGQCKRIGVFQGGVGGQDRVVGLDDGSGDLGSWVDGEFQFGFLSVVDGQTFHQQGGESGTGASSERVEDQEALETGALVGKLADAVKHQIDDLLADGVVTTSVVVGSIFLAGDELFGVEESAVPC